MAVLLVAAYFLFRVFAWFVMTAVKFAFTVAFLALVVLAMSSSVGLV